MHRAADGFPTKLRAPLLRHRPLRVLMVVESAAGGTGRHVLDLSQGLIARGCDVHIVYSTRRIDALFRERLATMPGLRMRALPMRTSIHPADLAVTCALRRYARAFGPFDVVHGHSSKGGALARLAAMAGGAAAFYTLHGLIMLDPCLAAWKRAFYLAIERLLSWRTARIIAVSPEEARAAVALGLGASRVITIPNGIGPDVRAARNTARRAIGAADDGEIVIGFVGRLVEQKAPDVLVRAFALAAQRAPRLRLAIVGGGPLEQPLRDLAARQNVGERIVWLGERDARGLIAGFDMFAIASRKEGLPYVVLEAMAAGLPIVATSTAGVESLVLTGENGRVVPPGDVSRFAEAIVQLATDAPMRARWGQVSQARAALFTIDAMVDKTLEAYYEAIRARCAGSRTTLNVLGS